MKKKGLFFMIVMAGMFSAQAELVAHWSFDDGTCNDVAGKLNGTVKGNVSIVDSEHEGFGKAAAVGFDARDGIALGDLSALGIYTNSFTLSLWIRHTPVPSDEKSPQFWNTRTGSRTTGYDGIQGAIRKGSDEANGGKAFVSVGGGSNGETLLNNARVDNDKWHWIVIRYDRETRKLSYFEDGKHIARRDVTGIYSFNRADAGKEAMLGGGFGGMIDDVRIYNTALSSSEIGALY